MNKLIWTPTATTNIQKLYQFLSKRDIKAAQKAIQAIKTSVKILEHQPESGRPILDMPIEFREWPIAFGNSGYVILYRIDQGFTTILSVKHQKEAGY